MHITLQTLRVGVRTRSGLDQETASGCFLRTQAGQAGNVRGRGGKFEGSEQRGNPCLPPPVRKTHP